MNKYEKCFIGYVVVAVLLAGPAYLDSESSENAAKTECEAENKARAKDNQLLCGFVASAPERTMPKLLFWPAWLSYVAAKKLST